MTRSEHHVEQSTEEHEDKRRVDVVRLPLERWTVLHRHEVVYIFAHFTLCQIKLVQKVLHLGHQHVMFFALNRLNRRTVLE